MKKLLTFLLLGLSACGYSQNVVTNGSFETKEPGTGCPNQTGFNNGRPSGWTVASINGYTPDYFYPCASPGSAWYPGSNSQGCEYPLQGQSYTGLLAMVVQSDGSVLNAGSEYMSQQLTLTANQQYYVEFWVSAANINSNNTFVKTLGMYFARSDFDISQGANKGLHHLVPQVPNAFPAANFYTNTNGWTKISGNFTPSQSGTWTIIIGNFDSGLNNNPSTPISSPSSGYRQSYYYIDAVTVNAVGQSVPSYQAALTGPSSICLNSSGTYSIINQPFGTSVSWTASPSNLFSFSSGTGSSFTPGTHNANGVGTITATLTGSCSGSNFSISTTLGVGQPVSQIVETISNPDPQGLFCSGNIYTFRSFPGASSIYDYQWSADGGTVISGQGTNSVNVYFESSNTMSVLVNVSNNCGSTQSGIGVENSCGPGGGGGCIICGFSVSPNPASEELVFSFDDKPSGFYDVSLTSENGDLKKKIKIDKTSVIDISTIPNGTYYLNVQYQSKSESKRIIIKH